jgi:TRAP-type C4-dicarboxylate transport system substrate-binding protein
MRAVVRWLARRAVLSLLPVLGLLALPAAAAETLKIATISPEGSSWMRIMREGAAQVARDTQNRVAIRFYTGGAMGDDKAVLRKIRAGQLQGAAITTGSLTQLYGDVQLYNLPMLFRNYAEVDVVRRRVDPLIEAGIETKGFEVLGFAEAGFAYAMSRLPASSVQAARRQRMWIPDADPGAQIAVKAFGIDSVPLTIIDVLPMLQSGNIDAVAMPPVGVVALQWHSYLKHVLDIPLVYVYGTIVLDQRAFAKLSAADQATVRRVMGAAMARINETNRRDNDAARQALQRQGLRFITPNPQEYAGWKAAADKAVRDTVAAGTVSRPMYDVLVRTLEQVRAPRPAAR